MLTTNRWRNWRASDEKIEESPQIEPSKPPKPTFEGFDGSVSEEVQIFSDPQAWQADFDRWRPERCVSRPSYEDSQSVGSLLLDFAEWCVAHHEVPATRQVFEQLLTGAGFLRKDGLAIGVILRMDLQGVLHSQRATIQRT
jgi:hypothetical protein